MRDLDGTDADTSELRRRAQVALERGEPAAALDLLEQLGADAPQALRAAALAMAGAVKALRTLREALPPASPLVQWVDELIAEARGGAFATSSSAPSELTALTGESARIGAVREAIMRGELASARAALETERASADARWATLAARVDALTAGRVPNYQALVDLQARAGRAGLAADLAELHLLSARVAPRIDFRAVHVAHARDLFSALGRARDLARVDASEARIELAFGEDEGAEELATMAVAEGERCGAQGAVLEGRLVLATVARRRDEEATATEAFHAIGAAARDAGLVAVELDALAELGDTESLGRRAVALGAPVEGWGLD